jgi:hypothetical protein
MTRSPDDPIDRSSLGTVFSSNTSFLLFFALLKLAIHFIVNLKGGYGYFRDELYYLACSEHLDLGYVDQPPLSIYILGVSRFLFGDSIFALRLLPSIAGAATVYLTGILARELGGNRFAQGLACLAAVVSPVFLGMNSIYSMNSFDILFWTLSAWALVQLLKTESPTYWLLLGSVLGLGLLNKIGVLWLGFGIVMGLLLTDNRRWLRTRWPWIAGSLAFAVFIPYIVWNAQHNFAHLEFIRNATSQKYASLTRWDFIKGQFLLQNPFAAPVWFAGLWFLFFAAEKRFRLLGWVYVAAFLVLVLNGHTKAEYFSPIYTVLFAAGAVILEQWFSAPSRSWVKRPYILLLLLSLVFAPLTIPILPVETYIRYADALGFSPTTPEGKQLDKLPQFYADMFGWQEKAAAVARVYLALPDSDRAKCAIFGDNYGRCGAIDFFGKQYGLPKSIGRHNNYWLWGPRQYNGELMIILGGDLEDKQKIFESVEVAGIAGCDYCIPYEKNLRVFVCRKLNVPLSEMWNRLKTYI